MTNPQVRGCRLRNGSMLRGLNESDADPASPNAMANTGTLGAVAANSAYAAPNAAKPPLSTAVAEPASNGLVFALAAHSDQFVDAPGLAAKGTRSTPLASPVASTSDSR